MYGVTNPSLTVYRASAKNSGRAIIVLPGGGYETVENRERLEKSSYHRKLTQAEVQQNTLLEQVSSETPPAFLVHAIDDTVCHCTGSTSYAEALSRRGVAAEMHRFANGGHGFGLGRDGDGTSQWVELAAHWIKRM